VDNYCGGLREPELDATLKQVEGSMKEDHSNIQSGEIMADFWTKMLIYRRISGPRPFDIHQLKF
jgi:hypothetical protein